MHLRSCTKKKGGKQYCYWQLVESYRTENGPRQRVLGYLGDIPEAKRLGVKAAAKELNAAPSLHQPELFDATEPEWTQVDIKRIWAENPRQFGNAWLCLEVLRKLELPEFLRSVMPQDRAAVAWANMALVLILARLCEPSSELHIAEHYYGGSGLADLLGIPADRVNDDRLYRALDHLLPHKEALEQHLKAKLGQLFAVSYDLLLYDMTSTYFEGTCPRNAQARRGYSRDHRGDCKQVTIALVVTRDGLPLGYQVFDGNRADVSTVAEVVQRIEALYGQADRIWVMDRGMVSRENVAWLRAGGRRYILGTAKSELKKFEAELLQGDWEQVHEGLEVKLCAVPRDDRQVEGERDGDDEPLSPVPGGAPAGDADAGGAPAGGADGDEVFILCRSADRKKKEEAMHDLFIERIEQGLEKLSQACAQRKHSVGAVERSIGRLLGKNSRAEALFEVRVETDANNGAQVQWKQRPERLNWSRLSEGCYLLRSNISDWSAGDLWKAYIQLTQAETAFRIHKQDLSLRPIWHQRADRVQAHILVCFLAYVVWKSLAMTCRQANLGDEPRKVLHELSKIITVDVVMPTSSGIEVRRRCVARPTKHQAILLRCLGLALPSSLTITDSPSPQAPDADLDARIQARFGVDSR
jgi:transposase